MQANITTVVSRRGGVDYLIHYGRTAERLPYLMVEQAEEYTDKTTKQRVQYHLEYFTAPFKDGVAQPMRWKWVRKLLNNAGSVLETQAWPLDGLTVMPDMQDFSDMLWDVIVGFLVNSLFRGIPSQGPEGEIGFGHNYMPPFRMDQATGKAVHIPDAYYIDGNVVINGVVYTPESKAVNNYATHLVDGTPINPASDAEATV